MFICSPGAPELLVFHAFFYCPLMPEVYLFAWRLRSQIYNDVDLHGTPTLVLYLLRSRISLAPPNNWYSSRLSYYLCTNHINIIYYSIIDRNMFSDIYGVLDPRSPITSRQKALANEVTAICGDSGSGTRQAAAPRRDWLEVQALCCLSKRRMREDADERPLLPGGEKRQQTDAAVVRTRLTLCIFLYKIGSSVVTQVYPKASKRPRFLTCTAGQPSACVLAAVLRLCLLLDGGVDRRG